MNLTPTLLITPLIDFVTGKLIEAGTSGDKTKQAARATELLAINAALLKINAGDTTGLAALQAAIQTSALSPGEALALQSLLATLGGQLALVDKVAGGTLIGTAATAYADQVLSAANSVATAYGATAPAA